ncbi:MULTISPECIES: metallophosphoesterase family protein [Corynebacterium]|uniref:Metallophosphoesterase family protein n=1 Tax=Corynebacterium phoceense TaxID=1686286 RepID=A0A540R3Z0_9CORY|nr:MULTISPECIES: metallophosphoesterase family protein [Corynebacterium]KXB56676.1 Ser/Thr phosphatase family protein [Corynebacterium sp. DNF00584]TQE42452.1 metallophosphoesterase family protein [Corynebacterium phoceense]
MSQKSLAAVALALATATSTVVVPAPATAASNPIFRTLLQPGADETQAIVSWRTNAHGAAEKLEVTGPDGTQTFDAQEKNAGALLYKSNYATATGLKENTTYSYRVGSDEGGWSEPQDYTTGSFGEDWSFITVTDAQIGVGTDIKEQTTQWQNTIGNAVADVPDAEMIWSLGDQVEGWGAPVAQYDGYFSAPEIRRVPTNALPGNHELYASPAELKHYDEHFLNPNQEEDIRDFYFERNNVLFIGLDTNASSEKDIARHEEFLRKTIAERGKSNDWVLVGMHHSFFSQGTHYTDADVTRLREQLAPVMSELDVDAVLGGHDHIYTRTHLMNGLTPVEAEAKRGDVLEPNDGEVLYLTTTTAGGGKYYDFQGEDGKKYPKARFETIDKSLQHPSTALWRQDYTEDYMKVDVTGDKLTFTTYNANDPSVVDKVSLTNNDRAELSDAPSSPSSPTSAPSSAPSEPAPSSEPAEPAPSSAPHEPVETTVTTTAQVTKVVTSTKEGPTPEIVTSTKVEPVPTTITTTVTPAAKPSDEVVPAEVDPKADTCDGSGKGSAQGSSEKCGSSTGGIVAAVVGTLAALLAALGVGYAATTVREGDRAPSWLPKPLHGLYNRFF